jgi:ribose-phosphate pyrophosphokinase
MTRITHSVKNVHCVIVDDIVDTAETLSKAAEFLMRQGAVSVSACVTHAILSDYAKNKIQTSSIQRIITTNSITHASMPPQVSVVSLAPALSDILAHILSANSI